MTTMLVRKCAAMARRWRSAGLRRVIACFAIIVGVAGAGLCRSDPSDDSTRPTTLAASAGLPCAWDALAAFAFLYARNLPAGWLDRHLKETGLQSVSVLELHDEARALGLPVEALTVTFLQLPSLDRPFIAHLKLAAGHFVTVERITSTSVRTLDSQGRLAMGSTEAFQQAFSGHILALWTPRDLYDRNKAPHLEIAPPEHSFGSVVAGQPTSFDFDLRNLGRSALDLAVIQHDPEVEVQLSQPTVPPEGLAQLRIRLTARPPVEGSPQARRQTILLSTNDPLRPRAFATSGARVIPALRVWPESVYFHRIARGSLRSRVVEVRCADGVQLGEISCDNPGVSMSLEQDRAGLSVSEDSDYHKAYRLVVRLSPSIRAGPVTGNVTICIKQPRLPPVLIPLSGEVLGPLRLSRHSLFFGFVFPGATPGIGLDIRSEPPRGFRLTRLELPAFLQAAMNTIPAEAGAYHVEVRLDATRLAGIVKGEVVLHTDLAGAREVRLPYYAHVVAK
jgi:hypothetical protein